MKSSEDELCRLFANRIRDVPDFRAWVLGHTRFKDRVSRLLADEQVAARPKVKPENWWRHWWCRLPELDRERETDIFLVFENCDDRSRFALHVENKQDAKFSVDQAEDYEHRARWMMATPRYLNYTDFQTMLISPSSVAARWQRAAEHFHCCLSYEDIGQFIPEFRPVRT